MVELIKHLCKYGDKIISAYCPKCKHYRYMYVKEEYDLVKEEWVFKMYAICPKCQRTFPVRKIE